MTKEEFKIIRIGLGYESPAAFGQLLGLSHTAICSKESGKNKIKKPLEMLMLFLRDTNFWIIEEYSEHLVDQYEFYLIRTMYARTPEMFAIQAGMGHRSVGNYESGKPISKPVSMLMQFMETATDKQLEKVGWIS